MTPWQRRKARRNAASKSGKGAVMPRIPSTAYSFLLGATTVVLGIAGLRTLCGGALSNESHILPSTCEVLITVQSGICTCEGDCGHQDLTGCGMIMVGPTPISLHSEQESRIGPLHFWEVTTGLGNSSCIYRRMGTLVIGIRSPLVSGLTLQRRDEYSRVSTLVSLCILLSTVCGLVVTESRVGDIGCCVVA